MGEILTEGTAPEANAEPVAEPAAPVTEATPAEATPAVDTQQLAQIPDEWREEAESIARAQFGELLDGLSQQMQQGGEYGQQQQGEFELDPFAEDYGQNLAGFLQQNNQQLLGEFQQIVAPLMQNMEQQASDEGKQLLRDAIGDVTARSGDYLSGDDGKTAVEQMFDLYKGEAAQRYGVSNRALEYAVQKADAVVRQIEAAAEKAAIERYQNERNTLAGAPRDANVGAASVAVNPSFEGLNEMQIADRWTPPV